MVPLLPTNPKFEELFRRRELGYERVMMTKPTTSPLERDWYAAEEADVPGNSYADLIEFTVPTGWILHVCAGVVSNDSEILQKCAMNFSPALLGNIFYRDNIPLALNPSATYPISAGSTLYVRMYNLHASTTYHFTVSLVGFEKAI